MVHPSDSGVQREAERKVIALLAAELGCVLSERPCRLPLADGINVEIDGVSEDRGVLVEVWAHVGRLIGAQPAKVMSDAFKLTAARRVYPARLILAFTDGQAAKQFLPGASNWRSRALLSEGIEVRVVAIPADLGERLSRTQEVQGAAFRAPGVVPA